MSTTTSITAESEATPAVSRLAAPTSLRVDRRCTQAPRSAGIINGIRRWFKAVRPRGAHKSGILPRDPTRIDAVLEELFAQRVAVDAEDLRRPHLVARRLAQHRAEQGLFDETDHQVVQIRAGVLAQAADALDELALDDLLEGSVDVDRRAGRYRADRQVLRQDDAGGRHHHGALDQVLELAHVAGPFVADESIEGFRDDGALAELARVLREQVLDQE